MTDTPLILIVEDEKKIAALIADYLQAGGFIAAVVSRGDQVLEYLEKEEPALIILDIMLPGMDGIEVCKQVRQRFSIPIIMLTARVEETDVLLGLEIGADDYICKPFSPKEVVARVKTVLRRTGAHPASSPVETGPFSLDHSRRMLTVNGRDLPLTPIEYGIIKILMSRPGHIVSRQKLMEKVQGYQFEGYNRTIDTHIKNLRKKIASVYPKKNVIISVYGAGYRFCDDA
nr:response regulator [uncultured Desulfobacter sp.]